MWPFKYDGVLYDGQCINDAVSIQHNLISILNLEFLYEKLFFYYLVQFTISKRTLMESTGAPLELGRKEGENINTSKAETGDTVNLDVMLRLYRYSMYTCILVFL